MRRCKTDRAVICRDLSRHFQRGDQTVRAVDGLDLDVAPGELFAVVGTSGSGKTTLLNLIGGLDTPSGGVISVMGEKLGSLDERRLALYRRTTVGIIFQAFHLLPERTALENTELPLMLQDVPAPERRERAREVLARVGLAGRADHVPSELSGGEQQRVAIARALIKQPRLLLADEPTGNLDSTTSREILSLLAELNRDDGLTIMLVSHDEDAMSRIAGRLIRLFDGRTIEERVL